MMAAQISDRVERRKPFLIGTFLGFAIPLGLSAIAGGFAMLLLVLFLMAERKGRRFRASN